MNISTIATAALVAATFTASAGALQTQQTPPKPACQTDEAFRAFDFWVGDWDVTAKANGQFAGNNKIEVIEGGCALLETWKGNGGSTGISTNHYNPITKKWRQLWLSGGAYSIDYEGGIKNGAMKMEGHIWYYNNGNSFPFRGTWTPQQDRTVRQHFEQFNPQNEQWVTWFDGIYTRSASTAE